MFHNCSFSLELIYYFFLNHFLIQLYDKNKNNLLDLNVNEYKNKKRNTNKNNYKKKKKLKIIKKKIRKKI